MYNSMRENRGRFIMATLVMEREKFSVVDDMRHLYEEDYEPLSDDELAQIAKSEINLANGNFSSWEDARLRLLNLP